MNLSRKLQLDTIYIDFAKAFDSVDHSPLLSKINKIGITGSLLSWYKSYLTDRRQAVICNGAVSQLIEITIGVPQGSHLGPILLNIFINDISESLKDSKLLIHADDLKVFSTVSNISDAIKLQSDLDSLQNWAIRNIEINNEKCAVISYTRKDNPILFEYSINNVETKREYKISDLGIIYTSNFDFSHHVNLILSKAIKLLGFIYRTTRKHFNVKSLILLYESLVVPILTYGSVIWTPWTETNSKLMEGIHHKLLRYLCYRSGQPMDYINHDYVNPINKFKIPPIKSIHKYYDTLTVYKIINNSTNCLGLTDLFCTRSIPYNLRNHREIIESQASSNYVFHSSIPRLIRIWKETPTHIKTAVKISTFKKELKEYLYQFSEN